MTKKSILIVDDDHDLVEAVAMRCRAIGLDVRTAHNTLTALAHMGSSLPDLVCLDVEMPTGNGLSFCEMMASDPRAALIPVIILSSHKDADTVRRCGDLCAYYVFKSNDAWRRLEPVIYELIDIEPPSNVPAAP